MHTYLKRLLEDPVTRALSHNPVVAILGPRQCGKSTLAHQILTHFESVIYLDLERPVRDSFALTPKIKITTLTTALEELKEIGMV